MVQEINDDDKRFQLPARWLTDVFGSPSLHEMSKVLLRCVSPQLALRGQFYLMVRFLLSGRSGHEPAGKTGRIGRK